MTNHSEIDVLLGVEVGKGEHHAVALGRTAHKPYDNVLPARRVR